MELLLLPVTYALAFMIGTGTWSQFGEFLVDHCPSESG